MVNWVKWRLQFPPSDRMILPLHPWWNGYHYWLRISRSRFESWRVHTSKTQNSNSQELLFCVLETERILSRLVCKTERCFIDLKEIKQVSRGRECLVESTQSVWLHLATRDHRAKLLCVRLVYDKQQCMPSTPYEVPIDLRTLLFWNINSTHIVSRKNTWINIFC